MSKLRPSRLLTNIVLATLLVIQAIAISAFIAIQPVSAPVIIDNWYSQPTVHAISVITVTNPGNARDRNNATFASFNYGQSPAGYFQLQNFRAQTPRSAPLPRIVQVDIKLRYAAQADGSGETYKIDYLVAPSAVLQPLQAATGAAYALNTRVWSAVSEPNNGAWDWTDIANIRLRITTSGTSGGTSPANFDTYEGWVTVVCASNPRVYVDPASIIDTSKIIGTTQAVTIRAENISDFYGVQFKFRYDPRILSQVTTVLGDYYPSAPWIIQNTTDNIHGLISIALSRNAGETALFGSGSIVTITFKVVGYGLTTLNLYDTVMSNSVAGYIAHSVTDGYFRNLAEPYGAMIVAWAPNTPQDSAFTVDINITKTVGQSGAFGVYSWEFNMTYDRNVLTATNVLQGPYLLGIGAVNFQKTINDVRGWVWANATLSGDLPGGWGNGTLAQIAFDIKTTGNSPLNFVAGKTKLTRLDFGAAVPFPSGVSQYPPFYSLPVTTQNDSVDVEFVPHDVAVTATASECPIAYRGYNRDVNVTVMNQGGWQETFSVMAYYESGKADVNGYEPDASWEGAVPWTLTGASPYLDAADYPTSYITASGINNKAGNFTFADIPSYGKNLVGVKLYVKTWNTVDDFMYVYVNLRDVGYDTWSAPYLVTPTTHVAGGDYVIVDLFAGAVLDTWAELNNTKVRLQKVTLLGTDTVGIDQMYLVTESQIGTTQSITDLPAGNSQTLTFIWDTSTGAYGIYEVFGRVTSVYGETDTADNILSGGFVTLTIPGDTTGNGVVTIADKGEVSDHWTGAAPYALYADIDESGTIGITDRGIVSDHWGESW